MKIIDIKNNIYSPARKIDLKINKINLLDLINRDDKYGKYAWQVISKIIIYSSSLIPLDSFGGIFCFTCFILTWSGTISSCAPAI